MGDQLEVPRRGLMRAAMLVPWAIPTVVSAKLWTVILRDNSSGILNAGIQPDTAHARSSGRIDSVVGAARNADHRDDRYRRVEDHAVHGVGSCSPAYKPSRPTSTRRPMSTGANRITQFLRLTIPLLRPTIAVALVFRTLDAVRVFDVFQVVLAQKQYSMATYNYYTLTNSQQLGYASAVGVVIFVIILLFTVAYVRILGVSAE
ncbi:MAG: sugar ABC transporter permease [Chloroflexi bacterium]|nr:sugar ABC transporter permease [Chloroflexota bacterium]